MSTSEINLLNLLLDISKTSENTYIYQYYSVLDSGAVVKVHGFVTERPTKFLVELSETSIANYEIKECLVPGLQYVVLVEEVTKQSVKIFDKDSDTVPKDYNFIIIATDKHTGKQIVCDPQVRNKVKY